MAIYDAGTASLAADGTVNGVGTTWRQPLTLIRVGATMIFNTSPISIVTIAEIISDTEIRVFNDKGFTAPTGTQYSILAHDGITVQGLAQDVAETLRYYQSREAEVAAAVDAFNEFDSDAFQQNVTSVNNQSQQVAADAQQVSNDKAQVSANKDSAAASAASALSDKEAAANYAADAAESAASLNTDNLLKIDQAASVDGFKYIGGLSSVAGFYNLVGNEGDRVILKGWYNGSSYGSGIFEYTTDIQRSQHDGGCIISPMVPYNGDSLSGQYVNGTGGTSTLTYGCWVRKGITEVKCEYYGMSGNPVSGIDYYPHFSKAILRAATDGYGILLAPNACKINTSVSIPIHQRAGGLVKYVKGYGEKTSVLNFRAAATGATAYAITFEGSLSVFSSFITKGFAVNAVDDSGDRADWIGAGIKYNKTIRLNASDLSIDGFEIGCNMTDSLYLRFSNVRFSYNSTALQGRFGELTGANAVEIDRCDFYNNAQFCVELQQSHAFKFNTCTFEANGGKSKADGTPIQFNSCVQFAQVGGAGNVAGTFDTCYFENNTGTDISFYVNRDLNQILNVSNTIFNYKSDSSTGARILVQSNLSDMSAGTQAILNVNGCGFWNITPTTATSYKDIQFSLGASFGVSHLVLNEYGNKWSQASPYLNVGKVEIRSGGVAQFRGSISSAGVVSYGRNISSVTKSGTGIYVINFTGSIANSIVTVAVTGGSGRYSTYSRNDNYSITVNTFNNQGGQVDLPFDIVCL